jgi:hypothetical protein
LKRGLGRDVSSLRRCGLQEEPADEGKPRSAERALKDEHRDSKPDEQIAEDTPDVGADPRCPAEVASALPERRPQHAAAVERQRRDQVEDEQREIDVAEPGSDAVDGARQSGDRDQHEDDTENKRHERSCDRDPKLGPSARESTLELRHAPEQPERDPVDLQPLSPSLPGMAELVQEDRDEEQESRDDRHREARVAGKARIRGWKDSVCERPDDQREDDEPTPVDPHLDAADATE